MKILVLGQSGSGKTFFATKLSQKYKLEHIEMDKIYKSCKFDLEKFYAEINNIIDKKTSWIFDGKYKKIRKKLIVEADQIYYLDLSLLDSIRNNILRELKLNGRITLKFIKHLFKVVREFYKVRRDINRDLTESKIQVIKFKNRNQIEMFLKNLSF